MNKTIDFTRRDPDLVPFVPRMQARAEYARARAQALCGSGTLSEFACGHLFFGEHREGEERIFREWAPHATGIFLVGDFSGWKPLPGYAFRKMPAGHWELRRPLEELPHGTLYKLCMQWEGGEGERIPAWCRRSVQDPDTLLFSAQIWDPEPYVWRIPDFNPGMAPPLVYEAHPGMATEEFRTGTFREFSQKIIPRIADLGYNTLQLMAVQEHPYYGSFGYHVSGFFSVSSRFGSPEDLKELVDTAHEQGIRVVMDLVHSHAVKNVLEGLGLYDGDPGQFFHTDSRRIHPAWDSLCFDYSRPEVLHFLLSNCKYWLEEYHLDGFRFDGVTSMLYQHHGLNRDFTEYALYFDGSEDPDGMAYLMLANRLIHEVKPGALTIAEEMSGMPGIASPFEALGFGFDYRLAMGTPDYWIRLIKEQPDETWDVGHLFFELTRKREEEKTIGYAESHDQALVGDQTLIFRLIGSEMYGGMGVSDHSMVVDRGMSLHKMIRLITLATSGNGYLNFMGNEFGHPEWIDFPREGNGFSYQFARRQWSLADNPLLKYHQLLQFDRAMVGKIARSEGFFEDFPALVHEDKPEKILAFQRGGFLFVFNFNPEKSYKEYLIETETGKYVHWLDTDQAEFGGYHRVESLKPLYTQSASGQQQLIRRHLSLCLPARCGLVLKKEKAPGIYSLLARSR